MFVLVQFRLSISTYLNYVKFDQIFPALLFLIREFNNYGSVAVSLDISNLVSVIKYKFDTLIAKLENLGGMHQITLTEG